MLYIDCPHCGSRDRGEFTYVGDAGAIMPPLGETDQDVWYRYVYVRPNPKGPHEELWQHTGGCRAVVRVCRNTLTHEILETRLAKADPAGELR